MHALANPLPSYTSFVGNAVAVRWGIHLAHKLGYGKVNLKTGSHSFYTCLSSKKKNGWPTIAATTLEDRQVICKSFQQMEWSWGYREGNEVADLLAKYAANQAKEDTCLSTLTPIRIACKQTLLKSLGPYSNV